MADRWLYIHAGAAHGPVNLDKLAQLASLGRLLPTDPVWPFGSDMQSAVDAHTLVSIETFPSVEAKVEEALATPPQPASETPDWLTDVEAFSEPVVPLYSPDVEVVDDDPAPAAAPPKPPAKPAKSPPRLPTASSNHAPLLEEEDEAEEEEEAEFSFKRRDVLIFIGLTLVGLGLAIAAGLFFASKSQRTTEEEEVPVE